MSSRDNISRLRQFVTDMSRVIDETCDPVAFRHAGERLLGELVRHDDWLPAEYAQPHPERYRQYLLHCDSAERFCVVSFVWGPGQSTPVHDHRIWGIIGMLRGAEISQSYRRDDRGQVMPDGPPEQLNPGDIAYVSPESGDIHQVYNAQADQPSISIHVYGANIGAIHRATYDAQGNPKPFISGYSNNSLPNLWDLSKEPA
jgi:predicted metal-dependent enzyme (double-stranded beta helix superfamily)